MNTSLQNHETASEVVDGGVFFKPEGKTATEKKVNAIKAANHYGVSLYGMSSKSKAVREAAADSVGVEALASVVRAKMSGSWRPMAGLFAFITGETIKFGADVDGVVLTGEALKARRESDMMRLQIRIEDTLESTERYTKSGKISPKWAKWEEARRVFEAIKAMESAELARREEVRKERELEALRNA